MAGGAPPAWRRGGDGLPLGRRGTTDTLVFDADDAGLACRPLSARVDKSQFMLLWWWKKIPPRRKSPIYGADRRAVLERKPRGFFRGTPYSMSAEGRETRGGATTRLLSAITNPELVQTWTRCASAKGPVAGIYSCDLRGAALLDRINVKSRTCSWSACDPQRSPTVVFRTGHQDQPDGEDAAARRCPSPVYPE